MIGAVRCVAALAAVLSTSAAVAQEDLARRLQSLAAEVVAVEKELAALDRQRPARTGAGVALVEQQTFAEDLIALRERLTALELEREKLALHAIAPVLALDAPPVGVTLETNGRIYHSTQFDALPATIRLGEPFEIAVSARKHLRWDDRSPGMDLSDEFKYVGVTLTAGLLSVSARKPVMACSRSQDPIEIFGAVRLKVRFLPQRVELGDVHDAYFYRVQIDSDGELVDQRFDETQPLMRWPWQIKPQEDGRYDVDAIVAGMVARGAEAFGIRRAVEAYVDGQPSVGFDYPSRFIVQAGSSPHRALGPRRAGPARFATSSQHPVAIASAPSRCRPEAVGSSYVPDLAGMTRQQVEHELSRAELVLKRSDDQPAHTPGEVGRVAVQLPAAGSRVAPHSAVRVAFYSDARARIDVPNLLGLKRSDARERLRAVGLTPRMDLGEPAAQASDADTVAAQSPKPGAAVDPHAEVTLRVFGPYTEMVAVPDLTSLTRSEAQRRAADGKLAVSFSLGRPAANRAEADRVIEQAPPAGVRVASGSSIALAVAGPFVDLVTVPDLVGRNRSEAKALLSELGLRVQAALGPPARTHAEQDRVLAQSPAAGSAVEKDGVVALIVAGPVKVADRAQDERVRPAAPPLPPTAPTPMGRCRPNEEVAVDADGRTTCRCKPGYMALPGGGCVNLPSRDDIRRWGLGQGQVPDDPARNQRGGAYGQD